MPGTAKRAITVPAIGARTCVRSRASAFMRRSASAAAIASMRSRRRATSPALAAPLSTRPSFRRSSSCISARFACISLSVASAVWSAMRCSSSTSSTRSWPAVTASPSRTFTLRTMPGVSAGTITG